MLTFVLGTAFVLAIFGTLRFLERVSYMHHHVAYRLLCGAIVASSVVMFLLILGEILQCGADERRAWFWRVDTALMLVLLALVAPAVQIFRVVYKKLPLVLRWLGIPLYALYLALFRVTSQQLPIERYSAPSDTPNTAWFDLRQDSLACVSFVGITTMAVLCGVSSVLAPYQAFFAPKTAFTQLDVDRLESSLAGIAEMAQTKELEINRLRLDLARDTRHAHAEPAEPAPAFSLQKLVSFVRFSDSKQSQLRALVVEQQALQSLQREVGADLQNVRAAMRDDAYFRTARGKAHKLGFAVFALYCIYRVVNSYIRMGWWLYTNEKQEGGPKDALVLLIAQTIDCVIPEVGVPGWTRIIGVFMSGAVLAAALNGVLQMGYRVMRLLRPVAEAEAATRLDGLLVSQVAGVYVLSIATTLRFNLPRTMSSAIMSALASPLNVRSVQLWNDLCLCATSTATLVAIVALSRVKEDAYDEEMGEFKQH